MFRIDSNQTIRVSRGDDFYFPLFVNQGQGDVKMRYYFTGKNAMITDTTVHTSATINSWVFVNKLPKDAPEGNYIFVYSATDESWKLNGDNVLLTDYGIVYTGTLAEGNFIKVVYSWGDGCEVVFKMYFLNNLDNPIFVKRFTSKDDLWIDNVGVLPTNGDMKITVLHDDLTTLKKPNSNEYLKFEELNPDQYAWKIQGKILDKLQGTNEYMIETLTNRNKIWIIDDDYSDRLWGNTYGI